jgi:ribose transport system ATP-binding protein
LSGGNQQKVVIGKWISSDSEIYIFDEPTRGIDVGAKIEVYNIMNELVSQGKCVIMISSELPEILGISDRIIVMCRGRTVAEIKRGEELFKQEDIMRAAFGEVS